MVAAHLRFRVSWYQMIAKPRRGIVITNKISTLLLWKLREQVERTEHLIALIPLEETDWRLSLSPTAALDVFGLNELLCHLNECLAGFCAALYAAHSDRLAHFVNLREMRPNNRYEIEEASALRRIYMAHIEEGFALITDDDLTRQIPTVFVPKGEALFTILIGNLEHYINHKYQLFFYLKMLGIPVTTKDLYHLRSQDSAEQD